MSRPTNNFLIGENGERKHIDFLATIAEIGEPFNSSLLEKYPEYLENKEKFEKDERESFLSILNKIGEDGCQILTDRVVNYIDDISNIDTTIPSALLSQANSLGYPYKDKKAVEQLSRLSKCSPILQSLVWAVSTKAANSITILERLNILSDETKSEISSDISAHYNTDYLNTEISGDIKNIFLNNYSNDAIFGRKYLYLARGNSGDYVASKQAPELIDFTWMANAIFADDLISQTSEETPYLGDYDSYVINFGKYNFTLFAIVCYTYLYSKIFTSNSTNSTKVEQVERLNLSIKEWNQYTKDLMPFLYNNNLFDPLQAAWSIIYEDKTLDDYEISYHEVIQDFMKAFNEKLNDVSYNAVIDAIKEYNHYDEIPLSENQTFVYKLNANSFNYQQLMVNIINDVKMVFGLDIKDYVLNFERIFHRDYFLEYQHVGGFSLLSNNEKLSDNIDWDSYVSDIIKNIFNLGKKIRTLREDLRVMTLRNSYKGTTALIQFSVIEYLKECLLDLVDQAYSQYNNDHEPKVEIPKELLEDLDNFVNTASQSSIAVGEYWDYTEYFNRIDGTNQEEDDGHRVDWYLDKDKDDNEKRDFAHKYGTMDENEIFEFYTKVLNIPKEIYFKANKEDKKNDVDITQISVQQIKLKEFLSQVYNIGVFTSRTNSNFESVYSGKASNTSNTAFWKFYKNTDYISKQIHPYIWNFVKQISNRLYSSSAVTTAIQNTEYEILINHISNRYAGKLQNVTGNILDQYRLSQNFVDSSGYITRYEHRKHATNEVTQSYDGIVYPQFGYHLLNSWFKNINQYWPIIKEEWYTNQKITLSESMAKKEISCLKELVNNPAFLRSISESAPTGKEISGVLEDYCIDRYETSYGVDPHNKHAVLYKENGYPFMRPLINGEKGMLFLKANYEIDEDEKTDVSYSAVSNDYFPRIVMSKDGTHLLLRTGKNKLSSYSVLTSKNKNNEYEKALKLNAEISCDSIIFEEPYFNDNLIKTIDDDFYILVPKYDSSISAFNNYLFYIKKTGEIKALKETFKSETENSIFKSGMFLNNNSGNKVIVNTFYIDKDQFLPEDAEVSAVRKNSVSGVNNHQTSYDNWRVSTSSFDVLNQFVQMYASQTYEKGDRLHNKFITVELNNEGELSATPQADLRLSTIDELVSPYQTEVSIENGLFKSSDSNVGLYNSVNLPFARSFNINSDAGFNPIYIGEKGKIILQDYRNSELSAAKETGAAFELLGPEIRFEENPTIDSIINDETYDPDVSDNDIGFERIHECYSFEDDYHELGQSFDISSEARKTSYRYGYASIVENEANKNDLYRIKEVYELNMNKFNDVDNPSCVQSTNSFKINPEDGYDYNRIYIFLAVDNRLYSLIPRKQKTLLQLSEAIDENTDTEFDAIAGLKNYRSSKPYSIKFDETYVFNEIKFIGSNSSRKIELYGNARELINTKVYLVHVVGKSIQIPIKEISLIDKTAPHTKYFLRCYLNEDNDNTPSLYLDEDTDGAFAKSQIIIQGENKQYYRVFIENASVYAELTEDREEINSAYKMFPIKDANGDYNYILDINEKNEIAPLMYMYNIQEDKDELNTEDNAPFTPNFMLPQHELAKSLSNISDDMIDEHMRAPHIQYIESYKDILKATTDDSKHEELDIGEKTNGGSLVFSLTEVDSDLMNTKIPDQWKDHKPPKSVTTEAINGGLRYQELRNTTFEMLNYSFRPFEIIDLDLKRIPDEHVESGIDERDNSVDVQYIIQPRNEKITVSQDDVNKYTISFWRKQENKPTEGEGYNDNRLPNKVKVTDWAYNLEDKTDKNTRPVYGLEHESINPFIDAAGFIPKLMVQWEYSGDYNADGSNDTEINLRFNNASASDSSFINTNAGLEYKSLSAFKDSIIVKPRESKYIDIVAPNHVMIGRTVFYNIPIMRALVTNISDNKPKFMLTILNDKTDKKVTLGYNNYALVFMSSSTPQIDNSNVVYTTCYVAPMVSSNQTTPPSISKAISLSELSFNFDIANVLNVKNIIDPETGISELTNNNLLVERINVITPKNKISPTAKSCISTSNDMHQIRVSEPYGMENSSGFTSIDMKINLQDLTKLNLKNALLTAHGNVIVYDKDGTSIPIVRIFGCSLDKIGAKHVLTINHKNDVNRMINNNIVTTTQSSNRTTAIQVTEDATRGGNDDSNE